MALAVLISLFIALSLIPMLCSRFLVAGGRRGWVPLRPQREGERGVERMFGAVADLYGRVLRGGLRARWLVALAAAGGFAVTVLLFADLGKELQPQVDEGSFILIMRAPQGATLDYTARYLGEVEGILAQTPEVATYFTAIGLSMAGVPKVNEGIGFLRLRPLEQRRAQGQRGQQEVMAQLRRRFAGVPGFITIVMPRPTIASTSRSAPLQFVIMGPEVEPLYEAAEELKRKLAQVPGIVDVNTNFDIHKPKLRIIPKRDQAADLGLDLAQVAQTLPADFRTAVTGQSEDMQESFASLGFTLVLAIVVVYMLLASQFNHLAHPFTIMLSLPLALLGAVGLLWLMDLTINLFSIIGIIMLLGLVTKNAILLVDCTNQLRQRGLARDEALVQAGKLRLRPILMTACSTILGVLPALIGLGSGVETRQPLAAAVVGGMLTSTLLTLVVIPAVYSLVDDAGKLLKRLP